jgi:hypothetical protein
MRVSEILHLLKQELHNRTIMDANALICCCKSSSVPGMGIANIINRKCRYYVRGGATMKKAYLVIMAVVLAASVLAGCSKGYESQKSVGELGITLKVDRYPLVKGDNTISVQIADQSGKSVTDATVNVRYYMPPMSGMAPMEFNTQAASRGGGYSFAANIPMEGGWKVDVTVTQPGKTPVNATFNVDAR